MRVISIDVGIRNLGLGIFESSRKDEFTVHYWNSIDIMCGDLKCETILKRGKRKGDTCGNPFKFSVGNVHYCASHWPYKNSKCASMTQVGNQCKGRIAYIDSNGSSFCTKHKQVQCHPIETKRTVKELPMREIILEVVKCLDRMSDLLFPCDRVLIEHQPGVAQHKVKMMSSALFTYFIIRGIVDPETPLITSRMVQMISAKKKMLSIEPNTAEKYVKSKRGKKGYATRKKAAIVNCRELLVRFGDTKSLSILEKSNKKDDLADAYLQAYWYMFGANR